MNIIFSFFYFLTIFLSFNSNSSCKDTEKFSHKTSPLSRKVLSSVDVNIDGPLAEKFSKMDLKEKKRKAKLLQSAPKRHSPVLEEEGPL
jgi:hypothetical protein